MSTNEYWRGRAFRALGGNPVADAVRKTKAIVGPLTIPVSEEDAQRAWEKLDDGEEPAPKELEALEVVIRILRPAPLSRNGVLDDLPDKAGQNLQPQELKDRWSSFRNQVKPLIHSIGRIEFHDRTHVGTGFFVGDGVIATNRHVLGDLTLGTEILAPGRAHIAVKMESSGGDSAGDLLPIEGVIAIHPSLDMVTLKVSDPVKRPVVDVDQSPLATSTRVVVIGYPGNDRARNPFFLDAVFQGQYGVKRASLGEILIGSGDPSLFHDCSTTGGSSGSPLFSLETGKVVGIHRGGFFLYRNEGVCGDKLKQFVSTPEAGR